MVFLEFCCFFGLYDSALSFVKCCSESVWYFGTLRQGFVSIGQVVSDTLNALSSRIRLLSHEEIGEAFYQTPSVERSQCHDDPEASRGCTRTILNSKQVLSLTSDTYN